MGRQHLISLILTSLLATVALAQSSPSFKLVEYSFNAGGHPGETGIPTSASFRITLQSLGEAALTEMSAGSASFKTDAGFSLAYRPPGEVANLRFTTQQTMEWNSEDSVGNYNMYRGLVSGLTGAGAGACVQQNLSAPTTDDSDAVPPGSGYFYLITAENRLGEEGTRGFESGGSERSGADCP